MQLNVTYINVWAYACYVSLHIYFIVENISFILSSHPYSACIYRNGNGNGKEVYGKVANFVIGERCRGERGSTSSQSKNIFSQIHI